MTERYPFPEAEWRGWWDQCHPQCQRDWAPVLRAMTPEQRAEFHRERLAKRDAFFNPDTTPPGRAERLEAERVFFARWRNAASEAA